MQPCCPIGMKSIEQRTSSQTFDTLHTLVFVPLIHKVSSSHNNTDRRSNVKDSPETVHEVKPETVPCFLHGYLSFL